MVKEPGLSAQGFEDAHDTRQGPGMTGSGADSGVSRQPTADVARRLAGSAVLVGVLLVIVALAAIRGQNVAGQPVAQPIKAAPQVGDCVTENPQSPGIDLSNLPALRNEPSSLQHSVDVSVGTLMEVKYSRSFTAMASVPVTK